MLGLLEEGVDECGETVATADRRQCRRGERDNVARSGDDGADVRVAVGELRRGHEAQTLARDRLEARDQLVGVGRVEQAHVEVLVEARDTERQRGAEGHFRLGVEALGVGGALARAAQHARELADQIEVTEQRGGAGLLEAQPKARARSAGAHRAVGLGVSALFALRRRPGSRAAARAGRAPLRRVAPGTRRDSYASCRGHRRRRSRNRRAGAARRARPGRWSRG